MNEINKNSSLSSKKPYQEPSLRVYGDVLDPYEDNNKALLTHNDGMANKTN